MKLRRWLTIDILSSPQGRRDSSSHEEDFLLRWRPASTVCIRICSYIASTGMTFRKPCGSSQFCDSSDSLVITIWQGERECILVKHARAFTQANDLAWNPQTLFRCQGTTHLFSRTMQKTESNVAFIPFPKGQGVFPRRLISMATGGRNQRWLRICTNASKQNSCTS